MLRAVETFNSIGLEHIFIKSYNWFLWSDKYGKHGVCRTPSPSFYLHTRKDQYKSWISRTANQSYSDWHLVWENGQWVYLLLSSGLPSWRSGKDCTSQCREYRRHQFDTWVGKSPWKRNWQPVQDSCLKNSMDRSAWRTIVLEVARLSAHKWEVPFVTELHGWQI